MANATPPHVGTHGVHLAPPSGALQTLPAAVVGGGFIGSLHVEALRRLGIPVRGVLGRTAEASRQAAARLGVPVAYRGFDELLGDPGLRVVHVATPNHLHVPMVLQALEAEKHVVCEKPLAPTAAEAAQVVRAASRSKVATCVCFNTRFYPQVIEVASRIRSGAPGAVHAVVGSYTQDWLMADSDFNWRVDAALGGPLRAVADIGSHWLDLVQFVTGLRIVSVCADLHTLHERRRFEGRAVPVATDDAAGILLRFDNGARGNVWLSQVTPGRKNSLRFEIACAQQSFGFDSERPDELWVGKRLGNEHSLRDPLAMSPVAAQATSHPAGHAEGFSETWKQLFAHFYRAVAMETELTEPQGLVPLASFADGWREAVLGEAILQSHQRRAWVDVPA